MAATTAAEGLPTEFSEKLSQFRDCLKSVETVLEPIFSTSISETREKFEPLEQAKFDLVSAYALNSLFFMYLRSKGENVQEHDIKKELERIRECMCRVKDTVDKQKAARVNVPAVKRFVRNALWSPKDQQVDGTSNSKRKITTDANDATAEIKNKQPKEKRKKKKDTT